MAAMLGHSELVTGKSLLVFLGTALRSLGIFLH